MWRNGCLCWSESVGWRFRRICVRLDLSAVTFVDGRGVAALRHLGANDLEIVNCPEFIGELLRIP